MARYVEAETQSAAADRRSHREKWLPVARARRGSSGPRIFKVILVALVLAFIVWIPVELWGHQKAVQDAAPDVVSDQSVVGARPVAVSR